MINKTIIRFFLLALSFLNIGNIAFAGDTLFPEQSNPPKLVNDFAQMMNPQERAELEQKLLDYERNSSTQITIVTITSIGDNDIADYAIRLGKKWGVGKDGRDNGVVILAALQEHKIWIATGKGLEGALTDYTCGKIRDKMKPYLKSGQFYLGFNQAADDVIAATKGEFKGDGEHHAKKKSKGINPAAIIIIIIIIFFALKMFGGGNNGRGGRGGGNGLGDLATGILLGNLLSGGRGGGFGGGNDSGGDSGFGGFGGGDFGGGGAGGSWD